MTTTPMVVRLEGLVESLAERLAPMEVRSEAEIRRRTEAGDPPSPTELARNRRAIGIMGARLATAEKELEKFRAKAELDPRRPRR